MKTEENKTTMSNKGTEVMEAKNIAHLVGRMDGILIMMEFDILRIKDIEYLVEILIKQINEAKDVNERIFEMYKKNELYRFEKNI